MKTSRAKSAAQRLPRRWRTPPPLTRGSEPLEGMELLREVGGEVGLLLWQAYRNVMFWAAADPGDRGRLFSTEAARKRRDDLGDAQIAESLRAPLTALAEMLASPESVPAETVSTACTDVARWAEEEGYDNTALAYTQSAAVASPRNAVLALAVGQLARRRAELARAETWFRHTVMVARQTGDWDSYSRAYMALGNMLVRRGNFPAAHRMHIKALRAARRKGLANVQGMALHDLFVIATETGRAAQAEEYARQAFRAYGNGHSSLPALVHDVAYYWMNEGYFARAQPVLEAVLPHFVEPGARFKVQSNIARAAGGNGDRNTFRRYWAECTRLMKEPFAKPYAADALVELALGATSLAEWDRAEQLATRAAEVAAETGGSKAAFRAEWILDSVRKGRQVEKRAATSTSASSPAEKLAEQFLSSLAPA